MNATNIDEWVIEPADPSVGIFGDFIAHECAGNVGDEIAEAEIGETRNKTKDGVVTFTTVFRCPVDGATFEAVESWPADMFDAGPGGDE